MRPVFFDHDEKSAAPADESDTRAFTDAGSKTLPNTPHGETAVVSGRRRFLTLGAAAGMATLAAPVMVARGNAIPGITDVFARREGGPGLDGTDVQAKGLRAELAALPSTPVFGTSYRTYESSSFQPYYDGTYTAVGVGRYPLTGGTFYACEIDLPNAATISSLEFYVGNNDATATVYLYRIDPAAGTFFPVSSANVAASSSSVQVVSVTVPAGQIVSTQRYAYILGITFEVLNDASKTTIYGARIGFTGPLGTFFSLATPDRFVDTRPGPNNRGGLSLPFTSTENTFDFTLTEVAGRDGNVVPAGATAVVGNVTAVSPTVNGLFKILPGGSAVGTGTSTVNFNAGFNTANAFFSRLDENGQLRAYYSGSGQSDLLIDVTGYYLP